MSRHERAERAYQTHHWGNPATHVKQVKVPGLAEDHPLTEMGLLVGFHIEPMRGVRVPMVTTKSLDKAATRTGTEPERLGYIEVDPRDWNNNHLSWDPHHKGQRLYAHLSPSSRKDAATLWDPKVEAVPLREIAQAAGGRHGRASEWYPNVLAQPLGLLYYTSYYTLKENERGKPSPSIYIHRMGEEGGIEPVLAVSKDGNLWICGGSYTVPVDGITR